MKKALTIILAICLIATLFTACKQGKIEDTEDVGKGTEQPSTSKATESEKDTEKIDYLNELAAFPSDNVIVPIVKEPINMRFVVTRNPNGGPTEDLWFWKWLEIKGNIKAEVTQIDNAAWGERKQIMFASDQLPDIFLHASFSSDEIMRFGQVEGQLMPLNDLIENYAPNIKATFEKMPEVPGLLTTPDGNIYHLPTINDIEQYISRTFIRTSWIKQLGLKDPETLDELYDVLKAFKDKDPNIIPMTAAWGSVSIKAHALSALGYPVGSPESFFVRDGRAVVPAAEDLYIEYLRYFNKLYAEGLLDRDAFTQTVVQARAKGAQGLVGLAADGAPFVIAPDYWDEYEALNVLTSQWNDTKMWQGQQSIEVGRFLITNKCKYPEVAIRFADMYFTKQSRWLFWSGPKKGAEDEHIVGHERAGWWIDETDGFRMYDFTDDINNTWDYANAFINPISGWKLGFVIHNEIIANHFGFEFKPNPRDQSWNDSMDERVVPYSVAPFPILYLTQEASERRNELSTPINDYIREMEARFIVGDESFENFDRYLNELRNLGVEELIKIYQTAYDSYLQNLK